MRESRRTEKMHLPTDSTEVWLGSQRRSKGASRHRSAPQDSFEAWIEKRVAETLKRRKSAA